MKKLILKELNRQRLGSKKGWCIYFKGELLIMLSGKYGWEERHHALNALIRSLKDSLNSVINTRENNQEMQDIIKDLISDGTIKIEKS